MHKWIMLSLFIIASAMAVIFSVNAALQPDENADEGPPSANELRITGKNFEFNQKEYTVPAGTPIKISYRNDVGGGIHGMAIEGTDIDLKNNETAEFTFEPGTYKLYCSIMCGLGHDDMYSTIIVE